MLQNILFSGATFGGRYLGLTIHSSVFGVVSVVGRSTGLFYVIVLQARMLTSSIF